MFGLRSWRIGTLFGIPLEINTSWLFVFVLISLSLAFGYFPAATPGAPAWQTATAGAVTALFFFASIVAHEFSHSLVAKSQGAHIARITLFIFGGVSEMEEEPTSPGREFVMAFAGPAMSIVLAGVFGLAYYLVAPSGAPAVLVVALGYLGFINLMVGLFNLLPGFPMDGGRVLRAILWGITHDLLKATRWAARTGQAFGYLMVTAGILGVVVFQALNLVWFVFLGWFLASLAETAYQQQLLRARLSHLPVSAVMSSPVAVAPADVDLETMVDLYFVGGHHSRYPIEQDGELVGMLSLAQARAVPREQWRATRALDVAERDLDRLVVPATESVDRVLDRLVGQPGAVLATSDGDLVGILTRNDVVHALQRDQGRS